MGAAGSMHEEMGVVMKSRQIVMKSQRCDGITKGGLLPVPSSRDGNSCVSASTQLHVESGLCVSAQQFPFPYGPFFHWCVNILRMWQPLAWLRCSVMRFPQ
jgi:hypothetical protein